MVALSILGNQKEIDLIYPWLRDYALSPEFPAWERVYFLCRIGMLAGDADTWRRESERFISSPNYLLTATPKTNTAVEVVAQDLNLPLVRLGEVLAEQTGRDHVGYDLLLDYCHFNHRGAWMAAAAFAQAIEERGWLGAPATDADIWQTASDHAQEPWDMGRDYLLLGDWLGIDDSLASLVHRVPSLEQREERMSALGESGAAAPIQRLWQIHHQAVYNPREALVDQYMELMRSHPELPESGQSSELCARWAAVGP